MKLSWTRKYEELKEEIRTHVELAERQRAEQGEPPDEARHAAHREFGNADLVSEATRQQWGWRWLENLGQDFRYGMRMLQRSPGFAAVAAITLGLGIGGNTAVFSVVNAVLLRPLTFSNPNRLLRVESIVLPARTEGSVSYPDFMDWQKQSNVFERMAVFHPSNFALSGAGQAARLQGEVVSANLFPLLAVAPAMGRWFLSEEDQPGTTAGGDAVLLSHHLWEQRFHSDPRVIGRSIELDHRNFTIVGVMPAGFQFPVRAEPVDLWTTVAVDARGTDAESMLSQRGVHFLQVVARLKPHVKPEQAEAQMRVIVDGLNRQYPQNKPRGVRVLPEFERVVGEVRRSLFVLLGAVGCVLLIACSNLASLLLARATSRRKEMAIRTALGAGRWRIVHQVLVENLVLALLGGALGLLIAKWGVAFLVLLGPQDVPRLAESKMDASVLVFAFGVSLLTAFLLALAPAIHVSKLSLMETVKEGARQHTAGSGLGRAQSGLVVSQFAMTVVLLVAAGLLAQSLARLVHVDPGFKPDGLLSFRVDMPDRYTADQQQNFYDQLVAKLRESPDVRSVSGVFGMPLSGTGISTSYAVEGQGLPDAELLSANLNVIKPGYYATMGISLLQGRDFDVQDLLSSRPVAIVNDAFVRQTFGIGDPLGKRIRPSIGNGYKEPPFRTIVGVVRGVHGENLNHESPPEMFIPLTQCPHLGSMFFVIRTAVEPQSVLVLARRVMAELDSTIPLFQVKTADQYLSESIAQPRFNAFLLGIFAALAILVALVGIYGMLSYWTAQRTQEMGIRIALGAQRNDIFRIVLVRGAKLAIVGVGLGMATALGVTRLMTSLLFGVTATDPLTFIVIAILMPLVAVAACYVPAQRAAKVDPIVALRYE